MHKILIIKLGALGDIIMACPIIKRIQEHHGDAGIYLLTSDAHRDFFGHWPGLAIHSFARHGLGSTLHAMRWIRAQHFERIYDLQSNDRSGLLCAISGVRERVGNHPRYPYTIHPHQPWRGKTHIQERWREVLVSAGIDPGPLLPWLPIPDQERQAAAAWLRERRLERTPFAILHAGASPRHPEKRWPCFRELGVAIRSAGMEVVWAGGADDVALTHELANHVGIDASGALSLTQLAALGVHARFAVTNDSAPMHVLACAGIPVFGLFGPTDWRINHAVGQREFVISASPETENFVPVPLSSLPVADVTKRLRIAGLLG
ncbi:MAG: hypothetical protein A3H91_07175 [Gammaproteobacteria bacterium RIFCSPLOWO2_02_FULL_61_13]|nr:MAG: hypothetical protein A3H91_07175 [Gammaproteobacteria bacterium RIFCSPLOWO2_02_FULL_61_13]